MNPLDLQAHRGGCIICMDLRTYNEDYGYLLNNFKTVAQVLTDKLNALKSAGFKSEDAFAFGFSYGARVIAKAVIDFGSKFGKIDCKCDIGKNYLSFDNKNQNLLDSVRASWTRFRKYTNKR